MALNLVQTIREEELYPWEKDIVTMITGPPDPHKIHWFWLSGVASGKTSMTKYLVVHHDAYSLDGAGTGGKSALIRNINRKNPRVVVFDCHHSQRNRICYDLMIHIKDGMIPGPKQCVFNIPHVVVLANFPPNVSQLRSDRWKVIRI